MLDCWQYLLLAVAGAAAGFVDSIAGGGGLITLPALLWAGLPTSVALGTNKLQSTFGTTIAVIRFTRAGLIRWRTLVTAIITTFVAAVLGVWAVTQLDQAALERMVPVLLITIALYTALHPRLGETPQKPKLRMSTFAVVFGCLLGFYDGFFGPGTGSFWMLACVLMLGQDLQGAAGTTKALNLTSNCAALLAFAFAHCLRFDVGAAMIAGQLFGARFGSGLVIARGAKIIRPIFVAVTFALAFRVAWLAFR